MLEVERWWTGGAEGGEPGLVYQPWETLGGLGLQLRVGTRDAGGLGVPWLVLKIPRGPMSSHWLPL